jgi:quinol monooxygenase YgiN
VRLRKFALNRSVVLEFTECWRALAALHDHLAAAHFATVCAVLARLLAAAPVIRVPISVEGRHTDERHR